MTTDTVPKTDRRRAATAGRSAAWPRAPACSRPALATMLVRAHHRRGGRRGRAATRRCARPPRVTFDRLDSDGCMSTNDTVLLLASGASGVDARRRRSSTAAVTAVCARPGPAAARRRRGRRPRTSRSRCVGAASEDDAVEVGRAVARNNLVKTRDLRQRPELGPDPGRGRHHRGRVRARTRSTSRSTACGSAGAAPPATTAPRSTCPAGTVHDRRSTCTPGADDRHRSGPTTCPTPTSTRTRRTRHEPSSHRDPTGLGTRWARRPRSIEALPWLERFHGADRRGQVRRQRDDRRRSCSGRSPQDMVFLRYAGHPAGRRARRRPADLARCSTGSASPVEFRGGLRVTTAGGDGRRPDGARRPGRPRAGRADQRARPVRGRPVRRGRRAVHRRRADRASSTASRSTSAWSATSSTVNPGAVRDLHRRRPDPGRLHASRRTPTAWCTTSTPTPRPPRSPSRCGAAKLRRAHRRRGALPRLAGHRRALISRDRPPTSWPSCCPALRVRDGAEDGGLPARGARRRARGARRRRPGAALGAAGGLHRRGSRHDGAARRR